MTDQDKEDWLNCELPRQKWFVGNVGKRLYRTREQTNECEPDVYQNGLIVFDKLHAQYLFDCECELGLRYFETEKERDECEQKMKENK